MKKMIRFKTDKSFYLYPKHVLSTGALFKTSKAVEREITKLIPNGRNVVIVELGMGLGNITRAILDKMHPQAKLLAFEANDSFCDIVKNEIQDERLVVINDDAANLKNYVSSAVDCIISSLPVTLMGNSEAVFQLSSEVLKHEATLSQVLLRQEGFASLESIFSDYSYTKVGKLPKYCIGHFKK